MTKTIKLVSSDGQGIKVEEEVALRSKVIEDMLNDVDGVIPLFLVHSKSISNPTLNAWDREFIKLDSSSLYDLLIVCTEEEGQR
ncbi:hypothetical protein ZIOFF_031369 [Zingiber officinale]|uniref:SKP1 component POZ domain-containing protein n=1 Tax=Zingiber officinale TaxID=94328 RepID=A0A8J5GD20_ZINOF|nr:hypothetical protein ZIOFF_031369 [Zingiber officinale]